MFSSKVWNHPIRRMEFTICKLYSSAADSQIEMHLFLNFSNSPSSSSLLQTWIEIQIQVQIQMQIQIHCKDTNDSWSTPSNKDKKIGKNTNNQTHWELDNCLRNFLCNIEWGRTVPQDFWIYWKTIIYRVFVEDSLPLINYWQNH